MSIVRVGLADADGQRVLGHTRYDALARTAVEHDIVLVTTAGVRSMTMTVDATRDELDEVLDDLADAHDDEQDEYVAHSPERWGGLSPTCVRVARERLTAAVRTGRRCRCASDPCLCLDPAAPLPVGEAAYLPPRELSIHWPEPLAA